MTGLPVDLKGTVSMTSKPKLGPVKSQEDPEAIASTEGTEPVFQADSEPPVVPSVPDDRPVAEYEHDHEAKAHERDRSTVRMSEGTRQDILMFGRVQDPNDPTRWLTAADLPQ